MDPYSRAMTTPLNPDRMSPSERLLELGRILAAGLIRMKAAKSSALSAERGKSYVDFPAVKSGHATWNSGGTT